MARPFGIPVYISPYWLVFAVVLVVMYATGVESNLPKVSDRYLVATAFVLLLYVSVLVHELAHCVVARAFEPAGPAGAAVSARRLLRDRAGAADSRAARP